MDMIDKNAPVGIDLDKLEVLARAAKESPNTHSEHVAWMDYVAAISPVTILALITLARRAAADAPAADERALFEAWANRENAPFMVADLDRYRDGYVRVTTDMAWEAWKARAAHPIGQVSPAIDQAQAAICQPAGAIYQASAPVCQAPAALASAFREILASATANKNAYIIELARSGLEILAAPEVAHADDGAAFDAAIQSGRLVWDHKAHARSIAYAGFVAGKAAHAQQDAAQAETQCAACGGDGKGMVNRCALCKGTGQHHAPIPVSPSDATGAQAIKFALELAENENDDAAVSFLKAWNTEDAGYLKANWPDFDAATREAERRITAGEGEVRPLVEVLAALEELSRGAEIAKSDEWVNQRASVLLAALAPRHSLATSATGKAVDASAGGIRLTDDQIWAAFNTMHRVFIDGCIKSKLIDAGRAVLVPGQSTATSAADAMDAERYHFMMAVVDNPDGPEFHAMEDASTWSEKTYGSLEKDKRPESVILTEIIDRASAAMAASRNVEDRA